MYLDQGIKYQSVNPLLVKWLALGAHLYICTFHLI